MRQDEIIDYVTGAAHRGGASVHDLAARVGFSRSRASNSLWSLPATAVRVVVGAGAETTRWFPRRAVGAAQAAQAWRRFLRASHKRRAVALEGGGRRDEVRERLQRARVALALGDWDRFHAELRHPLLTPARLRRHISGRWLEEMTGELYTLRAGGCMESGRYQEAIRQARLALRREMAPSTRLQAWLVLGAALRMSGPSALSASLAAYRQGVAEGKRAGLASLRPALRNLHASAVAPSLAMGDPSEALRSLRAAEELRSGRDAAADENDVRAVQIGLAAGQPPDRLFDTLRTVGQSPEAPAFLDGWRTRAEASVVAATSRDPQAWNRLLSESRERNRGYGFQRRLVLARIASEPELFDSEQWPDRSLNELSRLIAELHKSTHGRRPSECGTCRTERLPIRAAHALGWRGHRLPLFWST